MIWCICFQTFVCTLFKTNGINLSCSKHLTGHLTYCRKKQGVTERKRGSRGSPLALKCPSSAPYWWYLTVHQEKGTYGPASRTATQYQSGLQKQGEVWIWSWEATNDINGTNTNSLDLTALSGTVWVGSGSPGRFPTGKTRASLKTLVFSCLWQVYLPAQPRTRTQHLGSRNKALQLAVCPVAQSRPTPCDSMNCSWPGSSVPRIFSVQIFLKQMIRKV